MRFAQCLQGSRNTGDTAPFRGLTVVGYDSVSLLENGGAKGVGASFFRVGDSTGATLTLKDLTVKGIEGTEGENPSVYLQFLTENGGAVDNKTYYWYEFDYSEGEPYSGTEGEDWCYGWYDADLNSVNAMPLIAGEGVWMYSRNTKYTLQCAGEVPPGPVEVTLLENGGAKLLVNPMPATIKVGDMIVLGIQGTEGENPSVYFQFLTENGGAVDNKTYYWYEFDYSEGEPYSGVEGEDWCYGWYDADLNSVNNLPVLAGEAVWMYSRNTKYSVKIDSVLAK